MSRRRMGLVGVMMLCFFASIYAKDIATTPLPGFNELAQSVAINGTILVAFTNMGYAPFAENMLLSLRKVGVTNTLIVALDAQAPRLT